MQPLSLETASPLVGQLRDALHAWVQVAGELRILSGRQLEAAAVPSETTALSAIIDRKEQVYRAAVVLSRRAAVLQDSVPSDHARHCPEVETLRAELAEALDDVACLEQRSQELLQERMDGIRAEMESLRLAGNVNRAYKHSHAVQPRFLDQRQ